MAKCRKCNTEIPDGKELCAECEQLNSESYLDSLLHTVASEEQIAQDAKNAKKLSMERMKEKIDPIRMEELEREEAYREEMEKYANIPLPDIPSPPDIFTPQENIAELLPEDIVKEEGNKEEENLTPSQTEMAFDLEIQETDLFPSDMPDDFLEGESENSDYNILEEDMSSYKEPDQELAELPFIEDSLPEETVLTPEASQGEDPKDDTRDNENTEDNANRIDTLENEIHGGKENDMAGKNEEDLKFDDGGETQEDILDLINSIYNSEESEFSGGEDIAASENHETQGDLDLSGQSDDMTDFFADVLPDEELPSIEENDITVTEPEDEEEAGEKKKKKKKEKKNKDKPGVFTRIFGNVRPERTEEEIAQMKEKVIADAQAKEAAEEEKKKKEAAEKEAKKKQAAEDKAAADKKKQENAKRKAEAAKAKKEAKQLAKDKKKQEVQNLIDAIDENEGRINRIGASIVFVFFAAIAITIIIGTKVYAYSQNLENAKKSFEYKHYNEAYNEIAGMDVKEEDEAFELKVMVVMYTHKQLNSFQHYYAIGLYPEALDSLLKGLERYDKYSALASIIDVTKDIDSIREEILSQLETVYSLTEKEAMELAAMDDHAAYTEKIYEISGKIAKTLKEDTTEEKK